MTTTQTPRSQLDTVDVDDHDELTHIIHKKDYYKGYVLGEEVEALCGKKWVPFRDPELFEVCEVCQKTHERMVNAT